ncbi:hypothetical protein GOBAR_AA35075 [Gossypium barbadense]|uniref:Uncharacterized protein n=1 Tax=Gossypium barbadense TaxID=3634 RepID=A0A2P5W3K2_GOSBA|nr:hypothetical protein GOBAR_AA35075 [Gossypium barbadense]
MGKSEVKGTVTSLSSMFPAEETQKAAKMVEEKLSEKQNEMNQLKEFIADNTSLINLVQKLPDELHHDIMARISNLRSISFTLFIHNSKKAKNKKGFLGVFFFQVPFGKAAFFPGRLIHTNEFLVLLGESYYTERTAKQTVEILKRRGKSLESKVDALKAVMQDLKAEASFFDSTASEAAEGLVEIREYEEDNSTKWASQSGSLELETPSVAEADNKMGASEDDDYARIMSRKKDEGYSYLDHGQRYSELYQSQSRKQLQQFNDKEPIEEMSNKYKHQDLTNQFASTGLTEEPVTKGEISHGRIIQEDTKTLSPSINASAPFEKKSVQTSKSEFDSSKAFTGSIVEHTQNLDKSSVGTNTTSLQSSGSQPSKPVSRFKMQRK